MTVHDPNEDDLRAAIQEEQTTRDAAAVQLAHLIETGNAPDVLLKGLAASVLEAWRREQRFRRALVIVVAG